MNMASAAHAAALTARHRELEDRIDQETHRPVPDSAILSALKKQKLRVKDAMERAAG
jgi:hypothetical protein